MTLRLVGLLLAAWLSAAFGAYPVSDDFERLGPGLGGNWTNPFGTTGTLQLPDSHNVQPLSAGAIVSSAQWTADAAVGPPGWAYTMIGPALNGNISFPGVFASGGTNGHVACTATTLFGGGLNLETVTASGTPTIIQSSSHAIAAGNEVGILWEDAIHFSCWWRASGAGAWTNVTGSTTDSNGTTRNNPGRFGVVFDATFTVTTTTTTIVTTTTTSTTVITTTTTTSTTTTTIIGTNFLLDASILAAYSGEAGALGTDSHVNTAACATAQNFPTTINTPLSVACVPSGACWGSNALFLDNGTGTGNTEPDLLRCTNAQCPCLNYGGNTAQITIVAAVKPEVDGGTQNIFNHDAGPDDWIFRLTPNTLNNQFNWRMYANDGGVCAGAPTEVFTTQQAPVGSWTYLAGTSDNINLRAYVNGVQATGSPVAYTGGKCAAAADFTIGANESHGSPFAGNIDEIAIFNRALTAAEVCRICRFGIDGAHTDRSASCNACTP